MIPNPAIYTDFQGLSQLRTQARENSPEALRAVAKQFEGLLMQMMLKSMRDASVGEGLMDNEQTDFYQGMFDQQLSVTLSQGRGMGLADMLIKQLGGNLAETPKAQEPGAKNTPRPPPAMVSLPQITSHTDRVTSFASPEKFVQSLWPLAQQTGQALGVAPVAIMAQAALETGWGQAIMQQPNGQSTHNLFGIKADSRWKGASVSMPSLEYSAGKASRRNEQFRAYDSYAASFADYANFLRSNPRYSEALSVGRDPAMFAHALRQAGYATDPEYHNKINNIINGNALGAALKLVNGMPLT